MGPFLSENDICIVFHFGTEKMIHQIGYNRWRSGFGKALSNELIIYSFGNHIISYHIPLLNGGILKRLPTMMSITIVWKMSKNGKNKLFSIDNACISTSIWSKL